MSESLKRLLAMVAPCAQIKSSLVTRAAAHCSQFGYHVCQPGIARVEWRRSRKQVPQPHLPDSRWLPCLSPLRHVTYAWRLSCQQAWCTFSHFRPTDRSIIDAIQREVNVALLSAFCFAWLVFLGALSCLHLYLAMSNITTNEQVLVFYTLLEQHMCTLLHDAPVHCWESSPHFHVHGLALKIMSASAHKYGRIYFGMLLPRLFMLTARSTRCACHYLDGGALHKRLSAITYLCLDSYTRVLWQMKGAWKDRVNYNSKGCMANLQAALCVRPPRSLLRGSPETTSEASVDVEAPSHSSVAPVDHPMLAVLPRVWHTDTVM